MVKFWNIKFTPRQTPDHLISECLFMFDEGNSDSELEEWSFINK